ncbi:MAG: acyloxyacyl hydrolase [Deltaproteobacteria bacterium]|nr:acyloxyacyl hydrolase [Deltaproteobacteria bacterium]
MDRKRFYTLLNYTTVVLALILSFCQFAYASDVGPLSIKGTKQFGINFGYGDAFDSNKDMRFASVYPYIGSILTDPLGKGLFHGNLEGIVEGAFSYVWKDQKTYSAGVNFLARYNFLPPSDSLRPFIQVGLGVAYTNLGMHNFGSKFNFSSNGACGIQYFLNADNAINFEWRLLHLSNAGIDHDNAGLNVNNFFVGYSRLF